MATKRASLRVRHLPRSETLLTGQIRHVNLPSGYFRPTLCCISQLEQVRTSSSTETVLWPLRPPVSPLFQSRGPTEGALSALACPTYSQAGESAPCRSPRTKLPPTATRHATVSRNMWVPNSTIDPGLIIGLDQCLSASVACAGCPLGSGVSGQPPRRAISDGPLGSANDIEEPPSGQAPQEASRRPATAVSVFAARQLEPPLCRPFQYLGPDPSITNHTTLSNTFSSPFELTIEFSLPEAVQNLARVGQFTFFKCKFYTKLHNF